MIRVGAIGTYFPSNKEDNYTKIGKFDVDESFIDNVTGIRYVTKKEPQQKASDLCVLAYEDLKSKVGEAALKDVDLVTVSSQFGDQPMPHTSAVVHGKLNLSEDCAAFDLPLGCSGFVYALHVMKSFMEANGFKKALLFTSEPTSDTVNPDDKSTDLLLGDSAAVTLLSAEGDYEIQQGVFRTDGKKYKSIIREYGGDFVMHGRDVFNFAIRKVPPLLDECLAKNQLTKADIDLFAFHQPSKYMIRKVVERLKIDPEKAPFVIENYGNTGSASIPHLLAERLDHNHHKTVFVCGFGVGLSWAATVLKKRND